MDLPAAFEKKMKALLGAEFDEYTACFRNPRYYGIRVNTDKISVGEFRKICPFKIRPIPWIENGFYYDGERESPAKHPYYFAGLYYLQEPSAMTPANRLPVHPGDKVLDLCAAPGGKATELGAKLCGQGMLAANDLSNSRAKGLLKNLEVFGISNMLVINEEPGKLAGYFGEYFDKILIDAPCSGEGMFRKDKKMIRAWEEHGPEYFSRIQRGIVLKAADMLRPGGLLLYSTCTFDISENEEVIEYLLEERPEFKVQEIEGYEGFSNGTAELPEREDKELLKTVRIFPHRMQGEGHFMALLKKEGKEGAPVKSAFKEEKRKLPEELSAFLSEVDKRAFRNGFTAQRLEIREGKVYYLPSGLPKIKGLRLLRAGLYLGELKKKRFEPSQALAMCLKKEYYPRVIDLPAEDKRVVKYLKGETLDAEGLVRGKDNGWYLFCVDGFPLGWGKVSGGMLKNKYLPGWRWQS